MESTVDKMGVNIGITKEEKNVEDRSVTGPHRRASYSINTSSRMFGTAWGPVSGGSLVRPLAWAVEDGLDVEAGATAIEVPGKVRGFD